MQDILERDCALIPESKPWLAPDLLLLKPAASDYGYKHGKKLVPCTQSELIAMCGPSGKYDLDVVWHPGSDRLTPVAEVEFLREEWLARGKKNVNTMFIWGLYGLVLSAVLALIREPHLQEFIWINVLFMGVLPICEAAYGLWLFRRPASLISPSALEEMRFALWVQSQRTPFTWILLSVSLCVSIVGFVCGLDHAIQRAGLAKAAGPLHEPWRLLSGALLHGNLPHLLGNLFGLASLGSVAELMAGRGRMACVFVLTTLGGSLFSSWWLPETPSVGISGGLMGLLGFLLVIGLRLPSLVPVALPKNLVRGLLTICLVGLAAWEIIDNAAHLGGGLAGAILGFYFANPNTEALPLKKNPFWDFAGAVAVASVVGAGAWSIFLNVR